MIPYKLKQLDERLRGEPHQIWLCRWVRGRHKRDGKVRPLPGQGEQESILTAQDDPRFLLAPEDAADASSLPAGRALLGQDRRTHSLKCNIRCCLFGG